MNCEKYSQWVSLYIDEELKEQDRIAFENHISNCNSCREEVDILQDITNNIKALKMIDPPEGFHQELMDKIKLEQQVIPLRTKKHKWFLNIKVASAVAAVFIFSTILFNPPKTKAPKESFPLIEDNVVKSRMMDIPAESLEKEEIQGATFAMEEILLETNPQTWIVESPNHKAFKEILMGIGTELGLEAVVTQELELNTQSTTIEITLEDHQKAELESRIRSMDETINLVIQEEIERPKKQDHGGKITLTIIINQSN